MYGNRTKAKIMEYFFKCQIEVATKHIADGKEGKPPLVYVPNVAVLKNVKGNKILINRYLLALHLDGYLTFEESGNRDIWSAQLTNKGTHALATNYFRQEEAKMRWKAFNKIGMTGATIAIAVTTIITLMQDKSELHRLEQRIEKIETRKDTAKATASPSIPTRKNGHPTNTKDSLKKD